MRYRVPQLIPEVRPVDLEAPEFEDDPIYSMLGMLPLGGIGGILAGTGRGSGSGSGTGSGEGPGQDTGSGGGSGGEGSQGQDGSQPGGDSGGWDWGGIWDINWPWPGQGMPGQPTAPPVEPPEDVVWNPDLNEWGIYTTDPVTGDRGWENIPQPGREPPAQGGTGAPGGGGGSQGREYEWDPFGFGGAIYGYPGVYGGDPSEGRDWGQVAQGIGGLVGIGEGGPSPFSVAKGVWDVVSGLSSEKNRQQSKQANAMMWQRAQEKELQSFFDAARAADSTWDGTIAGAEQILGMPVPQFAIAEDPFKIVGGEVSTYKPGYSFSRDQGWLPHSYYTPQIDPRIIEMYGASSYYDADVGGFADGYDERNNPFADIYRIFGGGIL